MKMDQTEFPTSDDNEDMARKPYATPELIVHGSVEKITEGTNRGSRTDQPMNPRSA
jgi:hypothetical protein